MAVRYSDLSPNPRYSLRFVVGYACACEEEGNCERFCEGGVRDFLSRPIGTYPPNPPSCEEGGNGERVCEGFAREVFGVHGVLHSLKAIKTARDTNLQKAMRSPFPCRHSLQ